MFSSKSGIEFVLPEKRWVDYMTSWKSDYGKNVDLAAERSSVGNMFCLVDAEQTWVSQILSNLSFLIYKMKLLIPRGWCSQNYMRKWKYVNTQLNNTYSVNMSSLGPLSSFQSYDCDSSVDNGNQSITCLKHYLFTS